jgi:prefoldin beta subunit
MATPQITPEQQEDIQRFNQLVQQLEVIRMNLQQLELEKRDVDIALKETKDMDSSTVIYRSAGRLLFQSSVEDIKTYLDEEKEKIDVRLSSLTNREKKLMASVKELQDKLMGKK